MTRTASISFIGRVRDASDIARWGGLCFETIGTETRHTAAFDHWHSESDRS